MKEKMQWLEELLKRWGPELGGLTEEEVAVIRGEVDRALAETADAIANVPDSVTADLFSIRRRGLP